MPPPDPLRLFIDLRWMKIGKAGGIEQATQEMLAAISSIDRTNHYSLFVPRATYHELDFAPGFHSQVNFSDRSALRLYGDRWRREAERADLVHSLVGCIHPDLLHRPGILTVSDLLHLHHPHFFSNEDLARRQSTYDPSIRAARRIICISEFTRLDVHRRFGIPLERLDTIGIIPGAHARIPPPPRIAAKVRSRLGLAHSYALFPAHPWLHKNHLRLLEAWSLLSSSLPRDMKLVLTGKPFEPEHPAAFLLARLVSQNRAVHLGYCSRLEMQVLLHGCEALVFPSLFEGFGLPVAEAIIARRPIACSNTTSLPEIAGPAAAYFDPLSPEDIARTILTILYDRPTRQRCLEAADIRQKCFSPEDSARRTLAAYRSALGLEPPLTTSVRPIPRPAHRERARHHARLAEAHQRAGRPLRSFLQALRTGIISPSMFWHRLVIPLAETIAAALPISGHR